MWQRTNSAQRQQKRAAQYQCTACRYQGLFVPAAVRTAAQYAQVDALPVKRDSQRSIARATDVARMSIAKRIQKAVAPSPTLLRLRPKKAQRKRWEARELDEIWMFMGRKKRKGWMAGCREG